VPLRCLLERVIRVGLLVLALFFAELQSHRRQAIVEWEAELERLRAGGREDRKSRRLAPPFARKRDKR